MVVGHRRLGAIVLVGWTTALETETMVDPSEILKTRAPGHMTALQSFVIVLPGSIADPPSSELAVTWWDGNNKPRGQEQVQVSRPARFRACCERAGRGAGVDSKFEKRLAPRERERERAASYEMQALHGASALWRLVSGPSGTRKVEHSIIWFARE